MKSNLRFAVYVPDTCVRRAMALVANSITDKSRELAWARQLFRR